MASILKAAKKTGKQKRSERRDVSRYINKQRTLVFSSRGITHRDRHFMGDIRELLPHSKKDVKMDTKDKLFEINEICEMKSCNNCIFFEARKHKDLYMWMAKTPNGPSAKFLVQNVHTLAEVKLVGNCLKGSRPFLVFDKKFDSEPCYQLLKEIIQQVWGTPKGHNKVKPFIDHVFSFFLADGRVWFRNYQITEDAEPESGKDPTLVEIGPRFVLNPIRILSGGFGGATLWENPKFVSPNTLRAAVKRQRSTRYDNRITAKQARKHYKETEGAMPPDELESVFVSAKVRKAQTEAKGADKEAE